MSVGESLGRGYDDPQVKQNEQGLTSHDYRGMDISGCAAASTRKYLKKINKKADIVIFNPSIQFTPINKKSIYGHIVNSLDGNDAETVIVDGEKLVENKEPVHLNKEKIEKDSIESTENLWRKLNAYEG